MPPHTDACTVSTNSRLPLEVVDRDVDRLTAPALDPHPLGHLLEPHRRGEQVPALDADVVVGAVGAEDRAVGIVLEGGGAVRRHLALAHTPHGHPLGHHRRSDDRGGLISALAFSSDSRSITLPPSTHGMIRSRSRIASQLSSVSLPVANVWL